MVEYDVQRLLEYFRLDSEEKLTKNTILEELDQDLPLEFKLGGLLSTVQTMEKRLLVAHYALDHKDELGLSTEEYLLVLARGLFLVPKIRSLQPVVGEAYNKIADVLATADQKYADRVMEISNRMPDLNEALFQKAGQHLGRG